MIDLHAHILPGVDDGAETLEESIQMCWISHQDGVGTIVATPHILPGIYKNDRSSILSKLHELQSAVRLDSEFRILAGADVHFSSDLVQRFENQEIVTINDNGRALMVEFDYQSIPYHAEEVLFQLITRGIVPIITHPERNLEIARAPKRYFEMIQMGCLGQVTAMSLTGDFGSEVRRAAEKLLSKRLIHVIASDAHSVNGRRPILSAGVKAAEKMVGKEEAIKMVTDYPEAIIKGRRPAVPEPLSP